MSTGADQRFYALVVADTGSSELRVRDREEILEAWVLAACVVVLNRDHLRNEICVPVCSQGLQDADVTGGGHLGEERHYQGAYREEGDYQDLVRGAGVGEPHLLRVWVK